MSRMVGRAKNTEKNGMKIQFSEAVIMLAVVIAVGMGIRWYFFIYRKSPGFVLGDYFGYVKKGDVEKQYELIDSADKQQFYQTLDKYVKDAPQARGYNMRIQNVSVSEAVIDPKKPNIATIPVSITVRESAVGEALYQQGTQTVEDEYVLRKNQKGEWRVWLQRSKRALLEKVKPSAQSTY